MALREVVAFLGYKVDPKSEGQVKKSLGGIKKLAVGLGAAFGARAVFRGLKNTIEQVRALGDEVDKTSKRLGVNAQALQELRFAAGLAGASNADVTKGLRTLAKNANEAAGGTKSFMDDFKRLGVSVKDGRGELKPTEQLFTEVGAALGELTSDSEKLALSQTLLGRSGSMLIPLFNEGADAIEAQRREARELGGVLDDKTIAASAQLTDDTQRLNTMLLGLKTILGAQLMPVMIRLTQELTRIGQGFRGDVLVGSRFLAVAFKILSKAIVIVVENLPIVLGLFAGLFVILSPTLALLLALAAGLVLVYDEYEKLGTDSQTFTNTLREGFEQLVTDTGSTFAAIGEVLATAFRFWGDMFLKLFGTTFQEQLDLTKDAIRAWVDDVKALVQTAFDVITVPARIIGAIGNNIATLGSVDDLNAGLSGAVAVGPRQLGRGASRFGSSVVNRPTNNVTVTVDASGSTASATDIADQAASKMQEKLDAVNRGAQTQVAP